MTSLLEQEHVQEQFGDDEKYPHGTVQFMTRKVRTGRVGLHFNLGYVGGCGYYNIQKGQS